MKKIFLLAIAALLCSCRPSSEDIRLHFEVKDAVSQSVLIAYRGNIEIVPLDEDGKGEWVLKGMDAVYATLGYGMDGKRIYAEKGDEAVVSFNGNDFMGTFVFDGKMAPAVTYLNSVVLTHLPDEDYALPFDEYVRKLSQKEREAQKLLAANDLKGTGDFVEVQTGNIRYTYACAMFMYPMGHMMMTQDEGFEPSGDYYMELEKYFVENELYLASDAYREYMAEAAHVIPEENRGISRLYPKLVAEMLYLADELENEKVLEGMMHHLAVPYIDHFGTEGIEDMLNVYRTYVRNQDMLAELQKKIDKWNKALPGKISPDFKAEDIEGRVWSLEDFKGKYVYIDIWATWCVPCRQELPYLKELETGFEGKDIIFLGLSVDKDKPKWEEMVKSGDLCGVQLYLGEGTSFQKDYKIDGIPRFILLDKTGRIIDADMSRPSSDETAKILGALN